MATDENRDSDPETIQMSSDEEPTRRVKKEQPQQPKPSASESENRVKTMVLQSEKRFVDLELGIAELKNTVDKFKDLDPSVISQLSELPELKQRIDDLEDLITVESAGIEELKDVMEEVRSRLQGEVPAPMEGQATVLPDALQQKIDDIESKISSVDELKRHVDEISQDIIGMKERVPTGPVQPGGSPLVSAKLDNLKSVLDELVKRKVEVDMKIERLDKSIGMMQSQQSVSGGGDAKREIDALNRNFSVIDSRMDAIESVSKSVSEELQRVRVSAQKFDTFEKASNMLKDMQSRMEEFKFIEDEIKRVSNRVEGFYQNIDQRLDKIREFERLFPQMKQGLDMLRDEVNKKLDEDRVSILDRATKDEASDIRDRLSQVESKISQASLDQISTEMEKMREDVMRSVNEAKEPLSVVNIELSDIMSRIVALETRLGNLESHMQNAGRIQPIVLE